MSAPCAVASKGSKGSNSLAVTTLDTNSIYESMCGSNLEPLEQAWHGAPEALPYGTLPLTHRPNSKHEQVYVSKSAIVLRG